MANYSVSVVILHPEDRRNLAARFGWSEQPNAADKNTGILVQQVEQRFNYNNESMRSLFSELRLRLANFGRGVDQAEIEDAMKSVWTHPDKPMRSIPRPPLYARER
jgi:hypothetical protein